MGSLTHRNHLCATWLIEFADLIDEDARRIHNGTRTNFVTSVVFNVPDDDTWVVAYCACPHHASGEIVDALKRRGHANAVVLDEGILVWRRSGYPLEGEAISPPPPPAGVKR